MHTNQHTNPLFQIGIESHCRASQSSPTREHPKPQESPVNGTPTRKQAGRRLCQCCRAVPWLAVLCTAVTVGALVVWDVYTDKLIGALLAVVSLIKAPAALLSQLAEVVDTVQIAVVAAVSAVMALLLLTAIMRQRQVRQKTRALTYTDWPQGWRMCCYMVLTVGLLAVLWVVCAALLALLCLSVTASGFALLGDIGAAKLAGVTAELNTAANSAAAGVSSAAVRASSAFAAQMASVPAALRTAAWYKSLNSTVSPLLLSVASGATANGSCPAECLDLAFVAKVLPQGDIRAADTCICSEDKLLGLQQQFQTMWRSGLAASIGLAALIAVGSWMLMRGVADCVSAWRDHHDATCFQREHQQAHQRESRVRNWVNSSQTSSFDIKVDQRKQEQLIAPELPAGSPPKKQRVQDWATAGDTEMPADIEQPAPHNDQIVSPTSPTGTLSSQPSYIRHTTASMARQTDTMRSVAASRHTDTVRSITSANSYAQRSRKRWQ